MAGAASIDTVARYLGRKVGAEEYEFCLFAQQTLGVEELANADDDDLDTLRAIHAHTPSGPLVTMSVVRPETLEFVKESCGRLVFKGRNTVRGGLGEHHVIEAARHAENLMAIEMRDVSHALLSSLFNDVMPNNPMLDEVVVRCRMSEFDPSWIHRRDWTIRNFELTLVVDLFGERARRAIDVVLHETARQHALENVAFNFVEAINPLETAYSLSRAYRQITEGKSHNKRWMITYDGLCRTRIDSETANDWFDFVSKGNSMTLGRGVPILYDAGLTEDERAYWKVFLRSEFDPGVPKLIKRDVDERMSGWLHQSQ